MDTRKRVLQANLNNQGGAFSVAYESQKKLQNEYIFDYYFPDKFIKNTVYDHLIAMGSRCIGELKSKNRFLKQYNVYKEFYNYLNSDSYDIVHIHSDTAWKACIYYLAAKRAKVRKIIVHSHSSGINGHYRYINYLLHIITKLLIKTAKYKCACSIPAAKWMFGIGDNVLIIRNGVDIEKFKFNKESRERIKKTFGITDKTVIGSVSDFSFPKYPEFIYELVKVFKNNPKYVFLFAGNRETGCDLKSIIEKDNGIKNVIFAGAVSNVEDYLSAMDIFILPSRFEGLPMCAIEAQVNGLYTIISDKVTKETKCSKYFSVLPLNVTTWRNKIESLLFTYDRNNRNEFLDIEKAESSKMADKFKTLYQMEDR